MNKEIIKDGENVYNASSTQKKKKRRNKSDLGENFLAPDGGWGWAVVIGAGFSNFSIFPPLQSYGLIYREQFSSLGFDAKQTTTIVNYVMAISSLTGIVNGAMFRRFSYRQVAITGSLLIFVGILLSAYCIQFWQYIISFSCIYGMGLGLCMASTSLAINIYFKKKRRRATGFAWTLTGLGPIIFPHISTFLLQYYGARGTILLYAGFTLNAFLCALTLQPVQWHTKKTSDTRCNELPSSEKSKRSLFSSQYLFNNDDEETPGYEITEPGTPMLAHANDGLFGSKVSLSSQKTEIEYSENAGLFKPNYFNRERESSGLDKQGVESCKCTCEEEKILLQKIVDNGNNFDKIGNNRGDTKKQMTFKKKIVKFFDLDLLKDLTFVNLALGMTIMMFSEMNFSVLTPFILNSYGYENDQISMAMSLLGIMDIAVRFLAPFFLEKIKLGNQVLFSFGILAISLGRMLVTLTDSFHMILILFLLIGFGKGFRTIFSPLIIPSYVPLNRLAAASGLQLVCNTIFSCAVGPILGLITDATNYSITIHFLNGLTWFAILMWITESLIRRKLKNKNGQKK